MKTPFDFLSVLLFAVIAVLYLHRSARDADDPVPLWLYAVTALTCAAGDVIANHGHVVIGAILLVGAAVGTAGILLKKNPNSGTAR